MCNFQEFSLKKKDVHFSSFLFHCVNGVTQFPHGTYIPWLELEQPLWTIYWKTHTENDSNKLKRAQASDTGIARPAPDCLTPDSEYKRETHF